MKHCLPNEPKTFSNLISKFNSNTIIYYNLHACNKILIFLFQYEFYNNYEIIVNYNGYNKTIIYISIYL